MTEPAAGLGVGPVRWIFLGESGCLPRYDRWPYSAFDATRLRADRELSAAEVRVHVREGDCKVPSAPPDFTAGLNWAAWRDRGGWLFCVGWRRSRARAICRVNAAFSEVELMVASETGDAPLCYPLDQILFWGALARCGGVLLHAAGVTRDGGGFALAGCSGAGKSTLSGLCADAGWDILNDDRVAVYPDGARWMVAGTPWHGSGRYAENRAVPLKAVYALRQDRENRAEPMSRSAATDALLPVTSIPWFDDTTSQLALQAMESLVAAVPVRRLRFTRSAAAVRALETDGA